MAHALTDALVAEGIVKTFGETRALDDVTLSAQDGELLCLLGPSGCGKTTLLRIMAGFLPPDRGRVVIGGRDVTTVPPNRRNLGMVFQSYSLWPHMTAFDNVAFGLEARRVPAREVAARVAEALDLVDLGDLASRYPRQLSGGQQQRVALARALVYQPSILLLDEPLSALDRKLRERMQRDLRALQRRLRITTLFVTHDQEEALILADRIAVMDRGRVAQIAPAREVYESPASAFVADFIGRTNFVPGVIEAIEADHMRIRIEGAGVIDGAKVESRRVGDAVTLAIRPERVVLSSRDGTPGRLDGIVVDIEYLGPITYVTCRSASGIELTAAVQNQEHASLPATGQAVALSWSRGSAVVL